jgi:hypothetical protein
MKAYIIIHYVRAFLIKLKIYKFYKYKPPNLKYKQVVWKPILWTFNYLNHRTRGYQGSNDVTI